MVLEELADDLAHVCRETVFQFGVGQLGGLVAAQPPHDHLEQIERSPEGLLQGRLARRRDASTSSAKPALAWSSRRFCAAR